MNLNLPIDPPLTLEARDHPLVRDLWKARALFRGRANEESAAHAAASSARMVDASENLIFFYKNLVFYASWLDGRYDCTNAFLAIS